MLDLLVRLVEEIHSFLLLEEIPPGLTHLEIIRQDREHRHLETALQEMSHLEIALLEITRLEVVAEVEVVGLLEEGLHHLAEAVVVQDHLHQAEEVVAEVNIKLNTISI